MAEVSDRMKLLRGRASQKEFAKKLGISIRGLINYEKGLRTPNADAVNKICAQTGVSSDWLLFGKQDPVAAKLGPTFADLINSPGSEAAKHLQEKRACVHEALSTAIKNVNQWLQEMSFVKPEELEFGDCGKTLLEREVSLENKMEHLSESLHEILRGHGVWLFFGEEKTADTSAVFRKENLQPLENTKRHLKKLPTVSSFEDPPRPKPRPQRVVGLRRIKPHKSSYGQAVSSRAQMDMTQYEDNEVLRPITYGREADREMRGLMKELRESMRANTALMREMRDLQDERDELMQQLLEMAKSDPAARAAALERRKTHAAAQARERERVRNSFNDDDYDGEPE